MRNPFKRKHKESDSAGTRALAEEIRNQGRIVITSFLGNMPDDVAYDLIIVDSGLIRAIRDFQSRLSKNIIIDYRTANLLKTSDKYYIALYESELRHVESV